MSEQFSFLQADEKAEIKEYIMGALANVMDHQGLGGLLPEYTTLRGSKSTDVIRLGNSIIARIYDGPQVKYLQLPNVGALKDGSKNDFIRIDISSLREIAAYLNKIEYSLAYTLESTPKDFSCCSRYEQCSNAKKCVHPDKSFALGCYYRKVLAKGTVFYGENRNI